MAIINKKLFDVLAVRSLNGYLVDNTNPQNPIIKKPQYVNKISSISRPSQTTVALANQQALVFETYDSISINTEYTDNYQLVIFWVWSMNTAARNIIFRIILDDNNGTQIVRDLIREPKDAAGSGDVVDVIENGLIVGTVDTGTEIREPETIIFDYSLQAGGTYSATLQWSSEAAGDEATIYESLISIEQKTLDN